MPSEIARSSAYSCEETNVANPDYPVPANFQLGSMGGYFTYEEAMQRLDDLSNLYPDYVSSQAPIGDFLTHEQRRIYWLRVSDNPATDEADEPEVLMTAVHHAREPGGLSQMIFFLYYLLENKDTNPEFKFLLDHTELYLVPILNPDGYIYNQTTNPNGGGFWRKNKRDNNNDGSFSENNDGVDLNRNYGHFWGYDDNGSSPSPSSATYRGTEGFSEPETQAMKSFCEQHQFQIALNYHTYSNLLIYPWGHIPSFYTPDSALFVNLAKVMTYENNYIYGTGDQTVGYVTNGDSDDWMYGEQDTKNKILSMTPEVGTQG
ncbi:MAG TPA: M14 family metallopeptidase, partial [Chitinophagales bacterium]|nr:M14 family metallopeptidase [Chitinophagales bacterium]